MSTIQLSNSFGVCRHMLAIIHYNCNADRPQAVNKDQEKCYKVVYPKYRKGASTIKVVKEEANYGELHNID